MSPALEHLDKTIEDNPEMSIDIAGRKDDALTFLNDVFGVLGVKIVDGDRGRIGCHGITLAAFKLDVEVESRLLRLGKDRRLA